MFCEKAVPERWAHVHKLPQQGTKAQAFVFSGTLEVRMALCYLIADVDVSVTIVQSGKRELTNASRHVGRIMIISGQSGSFDLKLCAYLKGSRSCSHLFLPATRHRLDNGCPAGHFTHCGSLHPGNNNSFYRIVRHGNMSILIMLHQYTCCTGSSNCFSSWSSDQRLCFPRGAKRSRRSSHR